MTPDEAKELLPIITAFAEGKPCQFKGSSGEWKDSDNIGFGSYPPTHYRIKPLPRVLYVNIFDDGTNQHLAYEDGEQAEEYDSLASLKVVERAVKFIEVIEDDNT